jgi:hypothetical protein
VPALFRASGMFGLRALGVYKHADARTHTQAYRVNAATKHTSSASALSSKLTDWSKVLSWSASGESASSFSLILGVTGDRLFLCVCCMCVWCVHCFKVTRSRNSSQQFCFVGCTSFDYNARSAGSCCDKHTEEVFESCEWYVSNHVSGTCRIM